MPPGGLARKPSITGHAAAASSAAERALRKLAEKLECRVQPLKVCYEAGPTGFVLARRLIRYGLDCVLMSPSKTERKPNEKIKTDKRDACKIARLLRNGDITEVRIPDPCSTKPSAMSAAPAPMPATTSRRAKQRLNAFLLRNGFNYSGKSKWTPAHMRYLRELVMPHDAHKTVLEEYMQAIDAGIERVARLVDRHETTAGNLGMETRCRALMACKGFQEVAAMTVISELGDLRRFEHPRALMGFLGARSRRRLQRHPNSGKAPSPNAATATVAGCSWNAPKHYRKATRIGSALTTRQEGQPKEVKELSWRMQNRLHKRYVKLKARGQKRKQSHRRHRPRTLRLHLGAPGQTQAPHPRRGDPLP